MRPCASNVARASEPTVAEVWTTLARVHQSYSDGAFVLFDCSPNRTCNAVAEAGRLAIKVGSCVGHLLDIAPASWSAAGVDEGSVLIHQYEFCSRTLAVHAGAQEILALADDFGIRGDGRAPDSGARCCPGAFHLHPVLSRHASARHLRLLPR